MTTITQKKRLNITLPYELEKFLNMISKRDNMPVATKASNLLMNSILLEEDKAFSKFAEERLKEKGKIYTHKEIWG